MKLLAWGANSHGQLGLGYSSEQENSPSLVNLSVDVIKIVGGGAHTFALCLDGSLLVCGCNDRGQLGFGNFHSLEKFTEVPEIRDVIDVALGWDFSLVLLRDGSVFGTGSNRFLQLGLKGVKGKQSFVQIPDLKNIVNISAGLRHAVAIDKDGQIFSWGAGNKGQLGRPWTSSHDSFPQPITLVENNVQSVSCGQFFTLWSTSEGEVWGAGDNKYKQISDQNQTNFKIPTQLPLSNVRVLSTGWTHCSALFTDKHIKLWGRNNYGQCCNGEFSNHKLINENSVKTIEMQNYLKILAGSEHCLCLDSEGSVFAWGWNEHGNLGNGTIQNFNAPSKIYFTETMEVKDIFVGSAHCFALVFN